jgi:hypothetical protein
MDRIILLRRLAFIKQLYKIGVEQSYKSESISFYSILAFHDSIEMFLKLLSEYKNIGVSNLNFLEYWTKIPEMTLKESMKNLNARRVNLKHKGLLPAKSEIEISRVNTFDFFDQNTEVMFGIKFSEISLIELVTYENVKTLLLESQEDLDNNSKENSIKKVAYAFDELINTYENKKSIWGSSPFFFGKSLTFLGSFNLKIEDRKMADFVDGVKESIEELRRAVKITCLGIDYKEYLKFKILTPIITRTIGGNVHTEIMGKKKWTKENCQFCIDFVIDSSLKLQEFDFDIETLEDVQEHLKFNFKVK